MESKAFPCIVNMRGVLVAALGLLAFNAQMAFAQGAECPVGQANGGTCPISVDIYGFSGHSPGALLCLVPVVIAGLVYAIHNRRNKVLN